MMTTTLFRVFQCRQLGSSSFHEEDYDIVCDDGTFEATKLFVAVGIIALPIGIPLSFWAAMRKKVQILGGQANTNADGGAKLVPDEHEDDSDNYSFLVQDYRPEYWYWEIVSYARKLTLSGWTVLVGRGTMGQIYFAMLSSSAFLIWHVRAYPFVLRKHNVVETVGEDLVLVMYTTCLMLRNDSAGNWGDEWVPREGYGWLLAFLYIAIVPSPIFFAMWRKFCSTDAPTDYAPNSFEYESNPLAEDSSISGQTIEKGTSRAAQREIKDLKRKVKTLQGQLQKSNASVHSDSSEPKRPELYNTRRASQVGQLKELAEAGMITDESLQKAKDNLNSYIKDDITQQHFAIGTRASLRQFLGDNRLLHHEDCIVQILGAQATEEDFEYLTEREMQTAQKGMTRAEAARFKRLVKSSGGEDYAETGDLMVGKDELGE